MHKIKELIPKIIQSAVEEILLIFPTVDSFCLIEENNKVLELLSKAVNKYIKVRNLIHIDSEDSNGVYFDISRAVNNSLWVSSRFSYMANYPRGTKAGNPDYYERKFFGGLRYQLNKDWLALANCYLTETDVEQGIWQGNYDSKELELSTGLEYLINKSWRVSGSYDVTKTDYENKSWADLTVNKYIVGVIYNIDKYDFYLWYDIPEKDNTATLGVAYTF